MHPRTLITMVLIAAAGAMSLYLYTPPTPFSVSSPLNVRTLREQFSASLAYEGSAQSYREIVRTFSRTNDFNLQHNVAHIVGETLYDVEGLSGIQYCDAAFAFGCYHGFFTRAVSGEGLTAVPLLDSACSVSGSDSASACRHGIGHGILEYLGSDRLEAALAACLDTTQPNPVAGCTSGVFMEYNVPLQYTVDGSFSVAPRPLGSDPYAPCPSLDSRFQHSCYYELPQWWEQVYHGDSRTIGTLCAALSSDLSQECFLGYGKVVAPSANYNPERTREHCEQIDDARGAYLCRAGAAWAILGDGNGIADALEVCSESVAAYAYACPTVE